jgi:hypothetical protein
MATTKPAPTKTEDTAKAPAKVYVRAVHGELHHLFTGVVFTADPKKVEIDGFLQAQIDAGKVEIVND